MLFFLVYPALQMVFYSFTNWDGILPKYKFIGLANYKNLFTEPVVWLSLKNNAVYALTAVIQNVIALQSVDREIYESSRVDGANGWQTFRYITLPSIMKIIELNLFLAVNGALQAYAEPLINT